MSSIGAEASDLESQVLSFRIVACELVTGVVMGLFVRLLIASVHLAGAIVGQVSGFSGSPVNDDGSGDLGSEVGALISATVLVLLFVLDFHLEIVIALIGSYEVMPMGTMFNPALALDQISRTAAIAFGLAVKAAAPLIIAAVILNFAFGLVNRIAPQVPVIFISAPFLLAASIWILLKIGSEIGSGLARSVMDLFARSF